MTRTAKLLGRVAAIAFAAGCGTNDGSGATTGTASGTTSGATGLSSGSTGSMGSASSTASSSTAGTSHGTTHGSTASSGTTTTSAAATSSSGVTTSSTSTTSSSASSSTTSGNVSTGATTGSSTSGAVAGYCNGVQLTDTASAAVYVATYPKSDELRLHCPTALGGLEDGGLVLHDLAGILDRNTFANTGTVYTIWPAGCDDLDAGASVVTPGATVPDGGTTVAAAVAGMANVAGPLYGIVTYMDGPYITASTGVQHSGQGWIQDLVPNGGTPAPGSGVAIYFPKASANDAGASGPGLYPAAGLNRGDVVAFTNLQWSPYKLPTNTNGLMQNQLAFQATSTVTVIGPGTLPPAVPLTGAQLASGTYMGMRVVQTTTPDTEVDTCPMVLFSP